MLIVFITTAFYFVPGIIQMVGRHGAGLPPDELARNARRWASMNWVRVAAVTASLAMGIRALLPPLP